MIHIWQFVYYLNVNVQFGYLSPDNLINGSETTL